MSYRIRPGRPLTGEVVRVARAQYERAIEILYHEHDGRYEAIHDARKCFKRLRGLFRLVRDAAPEFCIREDARVRDVSRTLSAVRDATALVETLDRLIAFDSTGETRETFAAIRERLAARRDRIAAGDTEVSARMLSAIAACRDGMAALGDLSLPGKRDKAIAVLAAGAAKNYARAVEALATARASGDPADWHDLRKRIKYHWMHVLLLRPAWPGEMAIRAEIADRAGEALGDDHDLAHLDEMIAAEPEAIGGPAEIAVLRAAMTAQSERLRGQV
ncbi:MAG: CHAD domain-containing protein, partial [Oricola sp.]